jgi:signal transduction histidine kinase
MNGRRASALSWVLTVLMAAAAGVFLVLGPGRPLPDDLFGGVAGAAFLVLSLAYGTVGAVISLRLPSHRIGWLFSLIGLLTALNALTYSYAEYGLHAAHLPFARTAAVVWGALEVTAPLLVLSLLLLPDGRVPSPRWRPVAAMALLGVVILPLSRVLQPGPLENPFGIVSNPLGIPGTRGAMAALDQVGWILTWLAAVLAVRAVRVRLRQSRGVERQQLKWVLAVTSAGGVVVVLVMSTWFIWPEGHLQERMAVLGVAFGAIPAAAGIAILRYRLYDIDIVINRALVYGALTVVLAITYAAVTLVLGTALGSGSAPATAAATLAVAVAFRPLRARLQDVVDRRFSRASYNAVHRVAAFLEDVRAGRALPEDVEAVLREVLDDPLLELRFLLPESGRWVDLRGQPVTHDADDPRHRTPIDRAGTPIGEVLHDASTEERPDLLRKVVENAALAIEIVRLRAELRRRLDEVAASRRRIVAAGDEERRRIERNLHDGAQQRLVSIGLALRHAQHELGAGGPGSRAGETLEAALAEITVAIQELRELAQGLRPSQLDAGLGPALEELAGRVPLPVAVDATRERFSAGVEAAAYFIACEGLTNAAKHAHASTVSLSAQRRNGSLVVCVADDGVGGALPGGGSGLSGLADRVGAHAGTLRIESERGAGTRLIAELPCES